MNTKHLPLIIGISLPFIFIIVGLSILLIPDLFIKPAHDFIYINERVNYGYNREYKNTVKVESGKIALEPLFIEDQSNTAIGPQAQAQSLQKDIPTLYRYDMKSDTSHQITLEEAQGYEVDPGPSSPDGYTVAYKYGHNGIFELFGSNNNQDGYFISKDGTQKKLHGLTNNNSGYRGDFTLIGWIK